jgi:hypothetical protein
MAYMFSDIRLVLKSDMETYSMVCPPGDSTGGDAIDYAATILKGESRIINWADAPLRDKFLLERLTVAESLTVVGSSLTVVGSSGNQGGPQSPPMLPSN